VTLVAAISGASPIPITPATLQWAAGTAAPTISQAAVTGTGSGANLTLAPQAANTTGQSGDLVVNLAVPAGATTVEAGFQVNRAGLGLFRVQQQASNTSYVMAYGPGAINANNFVLNMSTTYSALNAVTTVAILISGITVGQFARQSSDFLVMGGNNGAGAGIFRLNNAQGNIITLRNAGNTADMTALSSASATLLTLAGTGFTTVTVGGSGSAVTVATIGAGITNTFIGSSVTGISSISSNSASGQGFQLTDQAANLALTIRPLYNGAASLTWAKTVTSVTYGVAAQTTDVATVAVTISGQSAFATAVTNVSGGNINISSGAPITGGTAPGSVQLQVNGQTQFAVGPGGIQVPATTVATTGGTLSLTQAQYQYGVVRLSGTLASNLTVVLPNATGTWEFSTSLLTLGAFTVTFSSGSASTAAVSSVSTTSQIFRVMTYGSNSIEINV
jgi:hypothetical protein